MPRPTLTRLLLISTGVLLLSAGVAHADRWDARKGDCERVFEDWRTSSLDRLRKCVMTWEMYRDITKVDSDQRAIVHEAFNKLYTEGSRRDAVMARSALKKLGLRTKKLRVEANAKDRTVDPREEARIRADRPRDDAPRVIRRKAPRADDMRPEPTRAPSRGEAKQAYGEAMKYYKSRDYAVALSEFLISADADPTYAQPLYMAARCYVFLGKAGPSIDSLKKMKAIGNQAAFELVARSSTDPVFAKLRGTEAFKTLTGTAVMQILNGAGDGGLKVVKGYKSTLEAAGMPVASVSNDRRTRQNTYIFHKPGYERQAEIVRRQLKLGMIHKRNIDWPSEFDVILIYGAKGKKTAWVDDEAEKAGKGEADKKQAADDKAAEEMAAKEKAAKAQMKKQVEMIKMMQDMNAESATGGGVDAAKGVAPPP